MRIIILMIVLTGIVLFPLKSYGIKNDWPVLKGPYLGQKPPGKTPEIFAPGIVSTGHHEHSSVTISPDGKSMFWSVVCVPFGQGKPHIIVFTELGKNGWSKPKTAAFSGLYGDDGPRFSPDGRKLYFYSKRPDQTSLPEKKVHDIWFVEKKKKGWSDPVQLDLPINSEILETSPSLTNDGTLYFMRGVNEPELQYDIYRSRMENVQYAEPEILNKSINSPYHDNTPFIAPDENFLLFSSVNRPDGKGSGDLYVCFRTKDDSWSEPVNLGAAVNTKYNERFPSVSPDRKYLFFVSNIRKDENRKNLNIPQNGYCDIYWVDAKIIEELRPKNIN